MRRKSINLESVKRKDQELKVAKLSKNVGQLNVYLPKISQLFEANYEMYKKKTLNSVVLDYRVLSYRGLCDFTSQPRLDESTVEESGELFHQESDFVRYERVVDSLNSGNVSEAEDGLIYLVNRAVHPAFYAFALMTFKELIRKCDIYNGGNDSVMRKGKDDIQQVVECLKLAVEMEPATSFLLGMLKKYNIGKCSSIMKGSWKDDLIDVVNVARSIGFIGDIKQCILNDIDNRINGSVRKSTVWVCKKERNI